MPTWALIGFGGFIGALMRFWISGLIQKSSFTFPAGTLAVNFIGSYLLSVIMYSSELRGMFSADTRVFLTIGILGAFTTMSTFSYESFKLLEQHELFLFCANVIGTVTLTLLAVFLGRASVTQW